MSMDDIAERLLEERVKLGLNQVSFARFLGISREALRNIEAGKSDFRASVLSVAAALGMDVQYIITGIRSKNIEKIEDKIGYERQANTLTGTVSGVGVVTGGNVHVINTSNYKTITKAETKPDLEHITVEQRSILQELVKQIVEHEEKLKRNPKTFRSVWSALNKHCKVNTYTLIALADFEKARKYLSMWLGRLNSMKTAPAKIGEDRRKRKYVHIHASFNQLEENDREKYRKYMLRNFNSESLSSLRDNDLDQVSRYVSGLKRSAKHITK